MFTFSPLRFIAFFIHDLLAYEIALLCVYVYIYIYHINLLFFIDDTWPFFIKI